LIALEELEEFLIRQILGEEAAQKRRLGDLPHGLLRPYADSILKLSERYTKARTDLGSFSAQDSEAYALYFGLINSAKVMRFVEEVPECFFDVPRTVMDFGAGPGTALFPITRKLKAGSTMHMVEQSSPMRELGKKLLPGWTPHTITACSELPEGKFDLIIAANSLNELAPRDTENLLKKFSLQLQEGGYLLVLEPALLSTTREVMKLRDFIVSTFGWKIRFPCTHCNECPMLKLSQSDWCHGELRWSAPRLIDQLDTLTGLNKHRIKYSGFLFQNSTEEESGYRILRQPQKGKGRHILSLCGRDFFGETSVANRLVKRLSARPTWYSILTNEEYEKLKTPERIG
jgi:ribosomal protein RSM22 (predicted rRNA methylase)